MNIEWFYWHVWIDLCSMMHDYDEAYQTISKSFMGDIINGWQNAIFLVSSSCILGCWPFHWIEWSLTKLMYWKVLYTVKGIWMNRTTVVKYASPVIFTTLTMYIIMFFIKDKMYNVGHSAYCDCSNKHPVYLQNYSHWWNSNSS